MKRDSKLSWGERMLSKISQQTWEKRNESETAIVFSTSYASGDGGGGKVFFVNEFS